MRLHKLNQVLENEPVSDVVRTSSYRPELFGRYFIQGVQEVLREILAMDGWRMRIVRRLCLPQKFLPILNRHSRRSCVERTYRQHRSNHPE